MLENGGKSECYTGIWRSEHHDKGASGCTAPGPKYRRQKWSKFKSTWHLKSKILMVSMDILMTFCYQLKQESLSDQGQPPTSQNIGVPSEQVWKNLCCKGPNVVGFPSEQDWTGPFGSRVSQENKFEQVYSRHSPVGRVSAWSHTVSSGMIGPSFEPHQCLLQITWKRIAQLSFWLSIGQQVLHQRWIWENV